MLSVEQLNHIDLLLNLGVAFFVLALIILVLFVSYCFTSILFPSDKRDKEMERKIKDYISDEIACQKNKELRAKDCALMNIESDLRYIREKIKENKK